MMILNSRNADLILAISICLLSTVARTGQTEPGPHDSSRWELAIKKLEQRDAIQAPPKQANLFVGSSSILRWKLSKYFPDYPVINRGFGGSQIADATHFTDRIVVKHNPRVVLLYSGDNDLAAGKSPEQVCHDFQTFAKKIKQELPQAKLVVIGIKPSLARWNLADKYQAANRLIEAECQKDARLQFVSVWDKMLDKDGRPRKELFVKDGLHLSHEGYQTWSDLVRPHLVGRFVLSEN